MRRLALAERSPQRAARAVSAAAPPFDPSTIPGLVGWWKADTIAQADGSAVASWADSAGTPHALTQATGANQPTYKTGILNGHAVVRFAGSHFVKSAAFATPQPATTIMVAKLASVPAGTVILADGLTVNFQDLAANSTVFEIYSGTGFVTAGTTDTNPHILVATENGASSNLRVDGGAGSSGTAGGASYDGVTLGAHPDGTGGMSGDMAEVLIYGAALSAANVDLVGSYLAAKYGLAWTAAT